ncbi:uncharacterized protein LOC124538357 [Vanessa cardui]|uniref:uncharacterized protein LOC124538357 n=1 Tax=Vanessa cardui TaxID=171605 RepID=UPI001F12D9F6|nr:uncharacterized protein LOC124538357 [Vanessa cardui]
MSTVKNFIKIDLNIGDQLTSISCGHIVVEIIKFLAYQRLQIPYTYQWLKEIVNKRKACENIKEGFQSERHFRTASAALDNLDFIIKSLLKEIGGASVPEEICIALGSTPITCKEVYRLILPTSCHMPQCNSSNIASDQKIQRTVFKNLVTSEKLSEVFFNSISPTNMYVFLKKNPLCNQDIVCSDSFVFVNGYKLPRSCKVVVLDFKAQNPENISCCNKFQVFGDVISKNLDNLNINSDDSGHNFNSIESTNEIKWFQSAYIMKGFKDCVVNGSSVTNAWCES